MKDLKSIDFTVSHTYFPRFEIIVRTCGLRCARIHVFPMVWCLLRFLLLMLTVVFLPEAPPAWDPQMARDGGSGAEAARAEWTIIPSCAG